MQYIQIGKKNLSSLIIYVENSKESVTTTTATKFLN